MTKSPLSRLEQNPQIGLYITKSGRITLDVNIGELCCWIKCATAGVVVYQDVEGGGSPQVWTLEAGETAPLIFDTILTSAIVHGSSETTTATGLIWGTSPREISK